MLETKNFFQNFMIKLQINLENDKYIFYLYLNYSFYQ